MAVSSHVESVDNLRRLHAATVELTESYRDQSDALRQSAERLRQWIASEQRQYWNQQLIRAERQFNSDQEELHRSIITDQDQRKGSTDARFRMEKSKKRVQLCQQKLVLVKKWTVELDHLIDKFLGRIGGFNELADQVLPDSARQLAAWIDALEKYTEAGGGGP
jgi:exonuclease VII large subunit